MKLVELTGKGYITAKVVADSVSENNSRITTLQLKYPRFIHSEFMTHRMFSRNASSSRAIPVDRLLDQINKQPAIPIHWGANQSGMQAREECKNLVHTEFGTMTVKEAWINSAKDAVDWAKDISKAGYHKQLVNRITEPYQFINVVVTATEWDNFFKLRLHPDAQPEIYELANVMKQVMDESVPKKLKTNQWHLPYIKDDEHKLTTKEALKASVARCARVSYLNHDMTSPDLKKDLILADKLAEAGHYSPFEHQAKFIKRANGILISVEGITHQDLNGNYWSGNFKNWVQYRQTLV